MVLPAELIELMNDTISIAPFTSFDENGNAQHSSPVNAQCYLQRVNKKAVDRKGNELVSTSQAILANPAMVVTVDDEISMPDGSHPSIIQVLSAPDENGEPYYLEVQF